MSAVGAGREFVVPHRPFGVWQSKLALRSLIVTGLVSVTAAGLVIAETIWPLHVNAPRASTVLETAILIWASLAAVLLGARYRRTRRLQDLLLLGAMSVVALRELLFMATLATTSVGPDFMGTGARLTSSLLITGALVACAFVSGGREFTPSRRSAWMWVLGAVVVLVLGELLDRLGPGATATSPVYEPLVIAIAFVAFCGLLVAGFGFASRTEGDFGEALMLAAASYLLAAVALQRLVLPLTPNDWLTPAVVFRVVTYALMLAVAVRMYLHTRDEAARESVSAERIRIARDLHDGLAQDLAFIAAHGETLMRELGEFHPLVVAARRALATSRGAIVDLEASDASGTAAALREVAAELEVRFGIKVAVRTETGADPDIRMTDRRELVRIAREAIVNAVHHGGAQTIDVTLGSRHSDLLLRICDDGCGLDSPEARDRPGSGQGMRTMRARAQALDGRLVARGLANGGTEISVVAAGPGKRRRRARAPGAGSNDVG